MTGRLKLFELLDFCKFGVPSVLDMEPPATSVALIERLAGKSFMSYGPVWSRLDDIVRGLATDHYILSQFNSYQASWKNESIRNVVRLLRGYLGGKGAWYPEKRRPQHVLGFLFKASIRGFWFHEGKTYAVLINARKHQPLSAEDVRFLGRGVYEIYCRENPNDPTPLILDVSQAAAGKDREIRAYVVREEQMAQLESFEAAVKHFVSALNIAGVAQPLPEALDILTLFKK